MSEGNPKRYLYDIKFKWVFEQETKQAATESDELNSFRVRALNNELVLGLIFDHLPKRDWKSARLVNKTWHSTLQLQWRNQMKYNLGPGKDNSSSFITVTTQFLEQQYPANNTNDPFQLARHPIRNISTWRGAYISFVYLQPDQTRFWEWYGHGLRCISFDSITIGQGSLLKRLLFELTPNLELFHYYRCICEDNKELESNSVTEYTPPATLQSNLKYVQVDTEKLLPDDNYKLRFPISWIEFMSVFPNIESLQLLGVAGRPEPEPTARSSDLLQLLEAIDVIRKANNNQVLNISVLCTSRCGFADVDVIENQSLFASLPISTLHMDITYMSLDQIMPVLNAFKSTLRALFLRRLGSDVTGFQFLPKDIFPQGLTKLSFVGAILVSLEFLSYTPNLEELRMDFVCCTLPPEVQVANISPVMKLTKLSYRMNSNWSPPEEMGLLARLMPNVINCSCEVDAEAFQALCNGWTNLKHLELRFAKFDSEDVFVDNLIKLKYLRSLKIYWCEFNLTDKSVFEGFLKLPSLTKIYLQPQVEITDEGIKGLRGKLCYNWN